MVKSESQVPRGLAARPDFLWMCMCFIMKGAFVSCVCWFVRRVCFVMKGELRDFARGSGAVCTICVFVLRETQHTQIARTERGAPGSVLRFTQHTVLYYICRSGAPGNPGGIPVPGIPGEAWARPVAPGDNASLADPRAGGRVCYPG